MSTSHSTALAVRPTPAQASAKPQKMPLRHLHNLQAAWSLVPFCATPSSWMSLAPLQQASAQKLLEQQKAWLSDWQDWWNTAQQLSRANTLSKPLEQEFDLALRVVQICGNYAVNGINLQENLEMNYGHWVNQQVLAAKGRCGVMSRRGG